MCRWIAYAGPPIYLDRLIFQTSHSLINQSRQARESKSAINADGFGVGWYADRPYPGVFKDIQPAWNDENLRSLTHQISSSLFFAHVRASTGTPISRVNCHPFRWNNWLFMHNGKIGGFDHVRHRLITSLQPGTFNLLKGATDSELMFMLMIDSGLADDPKGALIRMVGHINVAVSDAGVTEEFSMAVAFTDGKTIYAARYASHGTPPTLYYMADPKDGATGFADRQTVMIVSEPFDDEVDQWTAISPSCLIVAEPDGISTSDFTP